MAKTVGQNRAEIRDLAVAIMREKYRFADIAADAGQLEKAKTYLQAAEQWRVRARSHGANV